MDAFKVVCIVCALVGAFAAVSEAIKCYHCTFTADCEDDFKKKDHTPVENCTQCTKTKTVNDGKQSVARMCMPSKGGENKCDEKEQSGAEVTNCWCDTDLCNGTPRVTVTVFTLVTVVLVALKFM
ncbi:uncharacterized protein LOC128240682 [Mya arenaria]|uniref:uncharacterized protein LOC128240682 n=1 Tax=Mya arenaria TaxID=6604 RepID=UPI0022E25991|nr:uncharacterized protein LOC128240682 [Mya arenaria]